LFCDPLACSCSRVHAAPVLSALSLHDALPISDAIEPLDGELDVVGARRRVRELALLRVRVERLRRRLDPDVAELAGEGVEQHAPDRKSTRLNSSHVEISYAVFCLTKNKLRHPV